MKLPASATETFFAGRPTTTANSHSQSISSRPLGTTTSSSAPTTTLGDFRNRYGLSGRVSVEGCSHNPGAVPTGGRPPPPAPGGGPGCALGAPGAWPSPAAGGGPGATAAP